MPDSCFFSVSLIRISMIGLRTTLIQYDFILIYIISTSTKILFSNEITSTDTDDEVLNIPFGRMQFNSL